MFISNRPLRRQGSRTGQDGSAISARSSGRPPTSLRPERDRLLDFAAYRELVKDHQSKDTEDAKEVVQWVANRLRDEIGSIAKIVTDSYARGQISAADHSNMPFTCQGELPAILAPLVGQVLDAVYESATDRV